MQPHSAPGQGNTVIVASLRGTGELCTTLAEANLSGLFCTRVDQIARIAARKDAAAIIVDLDSIPGASDKTALRALRSSSGKTPIIGIYGYDVATSRDLAQEYLKEQVFDQVCTRPLDLDRLLQTLRNAKAQRQSEHPPARDAALDDLGIAGESPAIVAIRRMIRKIAATDVPVLVTGESGTGKELAARAIHQLSSRRAAPFVAINCAGLPPGLIASELFGHERGAFTGAVARKLGRLETASGGTSFLDEIGDFPLELQGHLLRFLQEKVIERVGATASIALDTRIVAATHIDLKKAVEAGRFREDLYYRLNVLSIEMPPLRARGNDIVLLADRFVQRFSSEVNRSIIGLRDDAIAALRSHSWPGNVRELIAVLQRAIVLAEGPWLTAADLGLLGAPLPAPAVVPTLEQARCEAERDCIQRALTLSGSNVRRAARLLGVSRNTLYRLAERHAIILREI
ncbi:MAG: sigma-54-dependent Fis family transcriptional regulator [Alphaproteobacteria bacterium]|nr:sigma-54-dependent Fis family transcriptional regulator [Alphaproteobacteria bacterium]